ncbi:hypothetical protein, partial [Bacillus cereus]|uniref:hypothetical protein n=1 Tax=Bacillus cereus TaxID=1396 RepID=UPI0024061D2B
MAYKQIITMEIDPYIAGVLLNDVVIVDVVSVTDREKQKYKNIHLLKEADLRKSSMKIQEYKILAHIVRENV